MTPTTRSARTSTSGKRRPAKSPGSHRATGPATRTTCSPNRRIGPLCSAVPLKTKRPDSDDPIASQSGDVYFYSPEQLDPNNPGVFNEKNLYVYRHGAVKYVATLDAKTVDRSHPDLSGRKPRRLPHRGAPDQLRQPGLARDVHVQPRNRCDPVRLLHPHRGAADGAAAAGGIRTRAVRIRPGTRRTRART